MALEIAQGRAVGWKPIGRKSILSFHRYGVAVTAGLWHQWCGSSPTIHRLFGIVKGITLVSGASIASRVPLPQNV